MNAVDTYLYGVLLYRVFTKLALLRYFNGLGCRITCSRRMFKPTCVSLVLESCRGYLGFMKTSDPPVLPGRGVYATLAKSVEQLRYEDVKDLLRFPDGQNEVYSVDAGKPLVVMDKRPVVSLGGRELRSQYGLHGRIEVLENGVVCARLKGIQVYMIPFIASDGSLTLGGIDWISYLVSFIQKTGGPGIVIHRGARGRISSVRIDEVAHVGLMLIRPIIEQGFIEVRLYSPRMFSRYLNTLVRVLSAIINRESMKVIPSFQVMHKYNNMLAEKLYYNAVDKGYGLSMIGLRDKRLSIVALSKSMYPYPLLDYDIGDAIKTLREELSLSVNDVFKGEYKVTYLRFGRIEEDLVLRLMSELTRSLERKEFEKYITLLRGMISYTRSSTIFGVTPSSLKIVIYKTMTQQEFYNDVMTLLYSSINEVIPHKLWVEELEEARTTIA